MRESSGSADGRGSRSGGTAVRRSSSARSSPNNHHHQQHISADHHHQGRHHHSGGGSGGSRRDLSADESHHIHNHPGSDVEMHHHHHHHTRRKHHMVSRGVGTTSDSRSTTPVISIVSQTSYRKKASGSGSGSGLPPHQPTRDKYSTLPARGSSKQRESKDDRQRFGSLERQKKGSTTTTTTTMTTKERRMLDKKQLSPIMEQDSPWEPQLSSTRIDTKSAGSVANGSAIDLKTRDAKKTSDDKKQSKKASKEEKKKKKNNNKQTKENKEPDGRVKKKESLGQRMRSLFQRKKTKKEAKKGDEADSTAAEDEVKNRYTEYKGTDATDNETDQYAVVVPASKRLNIINDVDVQDDDEGSPKGDSWRSSPDHVKSWHEGRHMSKTIEEKVFQFERKGTTGDDELAADPTLHRTSGKGLRFTGGAGTGTGHENEPEEPARQTERRGSAGQTRTGGGDSSGGESTANEDRSVHSHKSVVYLHSTAVLDIPSSRAGTPTSGVSRLNSPSPPYRRTVSRSLSVLAPWRPTQFANSREIDYSSTTLGRPPRPPQQQHHLHQQQQKKLVFTGPSFDPDRFAMRQPNAASTPRASNGKTRK